MQWKELEEDKTKKMIEDWKKRWESEGRVRTRRRRGARAPTAEKPPDEHILGMHEGLTKAESALLVQMRTECVGLNAFLFERRVLEVRPRCEYS